MFTVALKHAIRPLLVLGIVALALVAVACGGEETTETSNAPVGAQGSSTYQRIRPSEHVYTVDEVVAAGFKRSKTYDVTGLNAATDAIYGFYGTDPYNRKEYEIRFFQTHADAVQLGIPLAEEAVGANAKLTEEEATWKAAVTEERECQGNVRGSHHIGKCLNPKYLDMLVTGNLVILCQGRELAESQQTCDELMKVLPQ